MNRLGAALALFGASVAGFAMLLAVRSGSCTAGTVLERSAQAAGESDPDSATKAVGKIVVDASAMAEATALVERALGAAESAAKPTEPLADSATRRDDEWNALPRTSFLLIDRIVGSKRIEASELYRNTNLNPGDRYIGKAMRDSLIVLLEPLVKGLLEAKDLEMSTATNELQALIAAGRARVKDLKNPEGLTAVELRSLRERQERVAKSIEQSTGQKVDPSEIIFPVEMFKGQVPHSYTVRDGKVFSAGISDLPTTDSIVELRNLLFMETASRIMDWFVMNGCLSQEKKQQVLDEFVMRCERK